MSRFYSATDAIADMVQHQCEDVPDMPIILEVIREAAQSGLSCIEIEDYAVRGAQNGLRNLGYTLTETGMGNPKSRFLIRWR